MAHLLACNVTILSCCLDITLENISICMFWLLQISVKIGKHCEVEQVPCASHPCKRGGVCHPTPDYTSFTCRCPSGWEGMCSSACICVCAWWWLSAVILELHSNCFCFLCFCPHLRRCALQWWCKRVQEQPLQKQRLVHKQPGELHV